MVTLSTANIPPPKSWDEFEDITLSAAKLRWRSDDFFRNGRQGQKQDGVDIWGHDEDHRNIGVQCKNTIEGVSLAVIEGEVATAEAFEPKLDRLYIATTAKRDAKLQKDVRKLSRERADRGAFKVDVLFWDDICHDLSTDEDVFLIHYPQLRGRTDAAREHDKELFDKLTNLLRTDGVIEFLGRFNMAGFSFKNSELDPLWEFYYNWNRADHEFINVELEQLRQKLWDASDRYTEIVASQTFPIHRDGWRTVPPEWEDEQPERFCKVVDGLHKIAAEITNLHRQLIRKGREIFIGKYAE
jgi:hypothetical protein